MRVSREQAAENRDRIIDAAGRLFRERGFDGIGVANLMKAAGLTHGGFYGHFESKEDLEVEACARVLARSSERWPPMAANAAEAPLEGLLDSYLSGRHRDGQAKAASMRRWPRMSPGRTVRRLRRTLHRGAAALDRYPGSDRPWQVQGRTAAEGARLPVDHGGRPHPCPRRRRRGAVR